MFASGFVKAEAAREVFVSRPQTMHIAVASVGVNGGVRPRVIEARRVGDAAGR
jgi:hypothetical protein